MASVAGNAEAAKEEPDNIGHEGVPIRRADEGLLD